MKFKKLAGVLLATVMCFGLLGSAGVMAAEPDRTSDVIVQKLQFTGDLPQIKNDGLEPTKLGGEKYQKSKYGDVEFTIFQIDKEQVDSRSKVQSGQEIANEVEVDNTAFGAKKVSTVAVDEEGRAIFKGLSAKDEYYVILESKAPKTVVGKAVPMFLQLPVTNAEGNGYLNSVFLQAKNKVRNISISFNKTKQDIGQAEAPFANVRFDLYQGEKGSGTQVMNAEGQAIHLTTDNQGRFNISDLLVGKYYLVEEGGEGIDTVRNEQTGKSSLELGKYMVGKYAQNDTNNAFGFELTNDGELKVNGELVTSDNPEFMLINHEKPSISKKVNVESADKDEVISYTVDVDIPENIEDYSEYSYKDIADTNLKIDTNSIVVTADKKTLIKDTDYTLTEHADGYTINFVVNNTFTDAVKNTRLVSVKYTAKILSDEVKSYPNKVELTYRNSDLTAKKRSEETGVEVKTFGKTFIKKDGGRFGLGDDSVLSGAQFILEKTEDGVIKYLAMNNEGVYSWTDSKDEAHVFITGDDGKVMIKGLKKGSYGLREIKAPKGYNLPQGDDAFVGFNLDENSNAKEDTIRNTRSADMPFTGSEKLAIGGLVVVVLVTAYVVLVMVKKNKYEETVAK